MQIVEVRFLDGTIGDRIKGLVVSVFARSMQAISVEFADI
jgi:hypothetical protein